MNYALLLVLGVGVGVGGMTLTEEELSSIYSAGKAAISSIHVTNRSEILKAATVLYQVDNQTMQEPTPELLVTQGYLAPSFLKP